MLRAPIPRPLVPTSSVFAACLLAALASPFVSEARGQQLRSSDTAPAKLSVDVEAVLQHPALLPERVSGPAWRLEPRQQRRLVQVPLCVHPDTEPARLSQPAIRLSGARFVAWRFPHQGAGKGAFPGHAPRLFRRAVVHSDGTLEWDLARAIPGAELAAGGNPYELKLRPQRLRQRRPQHPDEAGTNRNNRQDREAERQARQEYRRKLEQFRQTRQRIDALPETFTQPLPQRLWAIFEIRANIDTLSRRLVHKQDESDCDAVLLTRSTTSPEDYGVIGHDGDSVTRVVEKPAPDAAPSDQRIVGLYLFTPAVFDHIAAVEDHEYALEDALDRMGREGLVRYVRTEKDTSSIKYPWDLFDVADDLLRGQDTQIAPSAEVHEDAIIEGPVVIDEDATVYENAVVRGPAYIGEGAIVGTNSIVRASTSIEQDVVVGANCEVRGSLIQPGTHLHQTYCGDSILGRDVRVGAGTVFTNRNARRPDGERRRISVSAPKKDEADPRELARMGAMVGDDTDIATQCNIMPGVMIGPGSFIGPSATVFEDVDARTRLVTRFDNRREDR